MPPWARTEREVSPSKIVQGIEALRRRRARVLPTGPAPMMAILGGKGEGGIVLGRRIGET